MAESIANKTWSVFSTAFSTLWTKFQMLVDFTDEKLNEVIQAAYDNLQQLKEFLSPLWEWLSNIFSAIGSIATTIISWFANIFLTLWDWLGRLVDNILALPKAILDGIKEIFIPDIEEIESIFNTTVSSIKSKFGFQEFHLDTLFGSSSEPQNITSSYNIAGVGSFNLTFFNTEYMIKGVNYFRPFIRGFMVLLICFYNVKNFLSFIGHDISIKNDKGGQE